MKNGGKMVVDAKGRRLYVCLRCGNQFWSRAKKPQCSVCKSKRVMDYEEFKKLSEEEQAKVLGKKKVKEEVKEVVQEQKQESKAEIQEQKQEVEKVKSDDEHEEKKEVKEKVKVGESEKVKNGEKVEDKTVKTGDRHKVKIPLPHLSAKAYAFVGSLVFVYMLYHLGFFDSVIEQLKRLGAFKDVKEAKEDVKEENTLIEKAKKNLR